ncbi:MAG: RNA-directed DNA polymerase [Parcubacteria group bacterium Licking1014_17]|nr:MAG: RNA-directed DNA polymerase [Parcubacteria group bacterium Licking1014_17]
MKIKLAHSFEDIISIENILEAWKEFLRGKRHRRDVQEFQFNLMDNILELHRDLVNHTYKHGNYEAFNICDPKPRNIHKASVRDRLLHHAIYKILYPFFDRIFISDSFSCRLNKGAHKALNRFRYFARKVSRNNTRTCWILKCDIRKFFANINHAILLKIISGYISDENVIWLLKEVVGSFNSGRLDIGLPLGNLTSQLFVNIYMNKFDQFIKHKLKIRHYIRYCDDFVILSEDRLWLEQIVQPIGEYLKQELDLRLHPQKIFVKTLSSGVDFLGWVNFPDHRILRTSTKRRMLKRIRENPRTETINSYLGLLKHGNTYKIREIITNTNNLL